MVHAFHLGRGTAAYTNRWVERSKLKAENAHGRVLVSGFSVAPGREELARGVLLNVANTHIIWPIRAPASGHAYCHGFAAQKTDFSERSHAMDTIGHIDLATGAMKRYAVGAGGFTSEPPSTCRSASMAAGGQCSPDRLRMEHLLEGRPL